MTKGDYPPLRMVIEGGKMSPATPFDAERIDSYRRGTIVNVRMTEDRDRVLVRKWWAVLGLAIKQCETPWKNKEEASEAIKLALGIVNLSKTVGGQFMQYPKSLTELDDPEMTDALEQMMELLHRITGVDPDTLRKEAASVGNDNSAPTDNTDGEATGSSSVTDAEPADAESSPASDSEAGEVSPPVASSASTFLVRFAKDVFTHAIDQNMTGAAFGAVMKRWHTQIEKLDAEDQEKAKQIGASAKRLFSDVALYEGIVEFYCEMLGCEPADLQSE